MCTGVETVGAALASTTGSLSAAEGIAAASQAAFWSNLGTSAMIGSTALQGLSTVDQALSGYQTGEANAKAAKTLAAYNARILAEERESNRQIESERFRRNQARRRAVMGATGASGASSVEVLAGAAAANELDMLTGDYNSDLEIANTLSQGNYQSQLYSSQASSSLWSLPMNLGTTLLSGGAKALKYRYSTR